MDKAFLKVMFSEFIKIVTFPFRLMPVKKNRILFTGLTGGNVYDYSCNPKYIYEYMRDNYPGKYEYIWMVSDPGKYGFLKEEGVRLYKHYTVSSFPMLLTSKVIVTGGSYAPWFPFRRSQYLINTWHGGGAYKKVENSRPDANFATKWRARFTAKNINLFLASCKEQENQMIRTTYQYEGEVLRCGTPRNDYLVRGEISHMISKVREYYDIAEEVRIILYAPTYRNLDKEVVLDGDYLIKEFEKTGDKWCLISRYHRYQETDTNVKVTGTHIINAADYPDMQELLAAADVLVTDYSSCIWDYAFLERPCVLYVPDKKEYNSDTGFYVGMDRWPFPEAVDMPELTDKILELLSDREHNLPYYAKLKAHLTELGSFETGNAAKCVTAKINEVMEGHVSVVRRFIKWAVFRVLYPVVYRISTIRPLNNNKAVFVENHENYLTDNYMLLYNTLEKSGFDNRIHYLLVSSSKWSSIIRRSLKLIWDIGNAGYIFLDESNSLFGSFKLRKHTRMIQLWHACGAFKKWGFSVSDKSFGDDYDTLKKYSGHRNYTLVPVSGSEVIWAYEDAFGLNPEDKVVKPLGVSRTDLFFDKERTAKAHDKLKKLPIDINGRKVIAYLPTFRGSIAGAKGPEGFDPGALYKFSKDMVILIKNHPFVKTPINIPDECKEYCMEITDEMTIEELIVTADVCITDYSSLVFEYSLMKKPILFYAYDMDSYDMERGFYYPYEDFVPGPIAFTMEELAGLLDGINDFDMSKVMDFRKRFMSGCDGHATERILKEIGID